MWKTLRILKYSIFLDQAEFLSTFVLIYPRRLDKRSVGLECDMLNPM